MPVPRTVIAAVLGGGLVVAVVACGSEGDYGGGGRKQPVGQFTVSADASGADTGVADAGQDAIDENPLSPFVDGSAGGG